MSDEMRSSDLYVDSDIFAEADGDAAPGSAGMTTARRLALEALERELADFLKPPPR